MIKIYLFLIGVLEESIAIFYYRMGQKEHKFSCMLLAGTRILIWSFVTYNIFKHINNVWEVVVPYMLGAMLGNFLSLTFEPLIEKYISTYILKVKKKRGRRKKKWWLWNFKNK